MSNCYAIEDLIPVVDPTAYVHRTAVLIGDVIIGPRCYVGPAACLRGDFGRITLQDGANVQDTCVIHGFPRNRWTYRAWGRDPRRAIGPNVLVGMNAVVMDRSKIGESSIIGAMSFLREGTIIPPRSLAFGIPARVARELTEEEIAWKRRGTRDYQHLAVRSLASQRVVEPLRAVQPDRPRFCGGSSLTLGTTKALMKR
ncbi:MAG: phenylacetic acid degradation protein PaaY [Xanthobacteraceae bacterium]